jgi:ferredoxin
MALMITEECINCDGAEIYEIDSSKCTECVGHFSEPQCQQVCPVSCIPFNPAWRESREQLQAKYESLQSALQTAGESDAK